ncbi:MAG TPA: hypothetical protein P5287_02900 [bacterium]|nr:hypothetical protein [bacterium]
MASDAEKLEVISGYYRLLDEEARRRLERLKQSDGLARHFSPLGYAQVLDSIYDIHIKHEADRVRKCAEYEKLIAQINLDAQRECVEEIRRFVSDHICNRKNGPGL